MKKIITTVALLCAIAGWMTDHYSIKDALTKAQTEVDTAKAETKQTKAHLLEYMEANRVLWKSHATDLTDLRRRMQAMKEMLVIQAKYLAPIVHDRTLQEGLVILPAGAMLIDSKIAIMERGAQECAGERRREPKKE